MIVVRNVFRLRVGAAKEAQALWKEYRATFERLSSGSYRTLVDVTGDFYTFVLEGTYPSLAKYEESMEASVGTDPEWKSWYARFAPLIESGHREILRVVET